MNLEVVFKDYFSSDKENLLILERVFDLIEEKSKKVDCDLIGLFDLESLMAINPDILSVVSALISPFYEAEVITDEDVKNNFGKETFEILDAIKKIHGLKFEENNEKSKLSALHKLFMIMAKNIRVVFVILSQRIYVMKNLSSIYSTRDKMMIAKETLHLYVPVASRLGVYRMKTILEDLSFKYVFQNEFEEISKDLEVFGKSRNRIIAIIKRKIEDLLDSMHIKAEVSGRIKSVYSIYKKFQTKNLNTVSDLYDIFAIRIILDSDKNFDKKEDIEKLYLIVGEIHNKWKPLANKFKDYVASPKANGYRSIHTIVVGLFDKDLFQPVEIQVRTKAMHNEAEYGVAAHWLYKTAGSDPESEKVKANSDWLKEVQKISSESEGELNVFKDRIFVLTPRGEIKDLPVGSTPIDFAYSVHTELGHKAYLAKVGERVVPLNQPLSNGDVVSISTKGDGAPKLEWLSFVKTSLAKSMIKSYFNALNVDFYLKEGKKMLNKMLDQIGKEPLDQNYSILKNYFSGNLTVEEREKIIVEVGKGSQQSSDVLRKIFPDSFEQEKKKKSIAKNTLLSGGEDISNNVLIGGESNLPLRIAKCCSPKYGDEIVAYFKKATMLTTIHKKNCKHLKNLDQKRVMPSNWK